MYSPQRRLAIALSVIGLLAFSGIVKAERATPDIGTTVQAAAKAVMQQYAIAGMSIAISHNGQQQFYNFGVTSKDTQHPVTADTLFEVGSISKLLTATLATYAQAKGDLTLTDQTRQYLPELKGSDLGNVALLHLATHTAGGFPLQVPDEVQNERQLMDYFKAWKPHYPAGTQRTYANPSIGMLGMIAAKSMNLPFVQAMQDTLFPALGLNNSYLQVPPDKMALYAQGYNKQDTPVRVNPGVLADEAYGVKTSSRDLLHFAELNIGLGNRSSIVKRAILDTHTAYFQIGPMTQDLIWEQYPYPVTLNTLLTGNADTMVYENNKAIALTPPMAPQANVWLNKTGSTSGFGGYIALVPAQKQAIVILANKNYPNSARIELAYRILKALN